VSTLFQDSHELLWWWIVRILVSTSLRNYQNYGDSIWYATDPTTLYNGYVGLISPFVTALYLFSPARFEKFLVNNKKDVHLLVGSSYVG
jgi:hypothetical protein